MTTSSTTKKLFGALLRKKREAAKKSMGDVARELGVSSVYVSDIERGNRAPLRNEAIERVAVFLKTDALPLLRAAAESRGAFEVDPRHIPPMARDFVAGLARGEEYPEDFWTAVLARAAEARRK